MSPLHWRSIHPPPTICDSAYSQFGVFCRVLVFLPSSMHILVASPSLCLCQYVLKFWIMILWKMKSLHFFIQLIITSLEQNARCNQESFYLMRVTYPLNLQVFNKNRNISIEKIPPTLPTWKPSQTFRNSASSFKYRERKINWNNFCTIKLKYKILF